MQDVQKLYQATGQIINGISSSFFNSDNFSADKLKSFQNIVLGRDLQQKTDETGSLYSQTKALPDAPDFHIQLRFKEFSEANEANEKFKNGFESLDPAIQKTYQEIEKLGIELTKTGASYENFDKISQLSLFEKQRTEVNSFNAEIELTGKLLTLAKDKYENGLTETINYSQNRINTLQGGDGGSLNSSEIQRLNADIADAQNQLKAFQKTGATTSEDILKLNANLAVLGLGFTNLKINQAAEEADRYANSLKGLQKQLELLKNGDKAEENKVRDVTQKDLLKDQIGDYQQIIALKERLANTPLVNQQQIEIAQLQDLITLRNKDTEAIISANKARLELSKKGNYSQIQADAKVLEYLNQNIKSSTDAMADFKIGVADSFLDQINAPFDKLSKKLEGLPPLVKGLAQSFLSLASDIVRAFSQKLIMRLLGLETPTANGASSGGFNLGSILGGGQSGASPSGGSVKGILQGIFGGQSSGSGLNSSNVIQNLNGATGTISTLANGEKAFNVNGSSGGGSVAEILGRVSGRASGGDFSVNGGSLGSVFNLPGAALGSETGGKGGILSQLLGKGGLFGKEGFGNNVGTYSTAGAGAALLGGLISSKFGGSAIGRRVGGVLSGAGSGVGIGASIGSLFGPGGIAIGAILGGIGGAILGFFGAGGQRKKDEQARTEFINSALASFSDFDKIISEVRNLNLDPSSGIAQATALGANIRSNYLSQANTLKDNKTRNIAIKDVSRVDDQIAVKMKALETAAGEARAANDIDKRLKTSFATGVYMDRGFLNQYKDYKKRNGILPGAFTGADTLPSMLAAGEMVLNPNQIRSVINNAGGTDVFKGAGIPNYATGVYVSPQISPPAVSINTGSNTNNTSAKFEPKFELHLSGVIVLEDEFEAYLESPDGTRTVVERYDKGKSLKIR